MSELHEMTANVVLHSARALAGYATSELIEARPEMQASLEPGAFQKWQNMLVQCLEELAAAIALRRPQLFVRHVQWLQSLLTARDVENEALPSGMQALSKVLATELPADSGTVASALCRKAAERLRQAATPGDQPLATDSLYGRLASSYLLAILEGDRARATRLILDAADAGHSAQDLYLKVLLPAQEEGGRMWQAAEINIAEEHFATATTRALLVQLRGRTPPGPSRGKTFVASAVAGNQHDIGLQAVADFFEMDGWRVIQLGCDVPVHDLVQAVGFYQADLLGLSVCLGSQLPTLNQTIDAVRRGERGAAVKILVGGRGLAGAEDLAAEFGADGYASDPRQAVALGRALVGLG